MTGTHTRPILAVRGEETNMPFTRSFTTLSARRRLWTTALILLGVSALLALALGCGEGESPPEVSRQPEPTDTPAAEPTPRAVAVVQPTPTAAPTAEPTYTQSPTAEPTATYTATPVVEPTPTTAPTTEPTSTPEPTVAPTPEPAPDDRLKAPGFDLPAAAGGSVSLASLLEGKSAAVAAVLVFYRGFF